MLRNFKDALDSHRQRVLAEEAQSDTCLRWLACNERHPLMTVNNLTVP